MEYRVRVISDAPEESVVVLPDGRLKVHVHAPRKDSRANERMRELLAAHFDVSLTSVHLRSGHTSATKTVNIAR